MKKIAATLLMLFAFNTFASTPKSISCQEDNRASDGIKSVLSLNLQKDGSYALKAKVEFYSRMEQKNVKKSKTFKYSFLCNFIPSDKMLFSCVSTPDSSGLRITLSSKVEKYAYTDYTGSLVSSESLIFNADQILLDELAAFGIYAHEGEINYPLSNCN